MTLSHVELNESTVKEWKIYLNDCLKLISNYTFLTDSFVLDFFSEDLWSSVPLSWRAALEPLSPQQLAALIHPGHNSQNSIDAPLPLSLLAFRSAAAYCTLPRAAVTSPGAVGHYLQRQLDNTKEHQTNEYPQEIVHTTIGNSCHQERDSRYENSNLPEILVNGLETTGTETKGINKTSHAWPVDTTVRWQTSRKELGKAGGQHALLAPIFRRHLKPKKQHEVARLSLLAAMTSRAAGCDVTADIGSGCGHLARLMAYGYRLRVVCVDKEEDLVRGARKFDGHLEKSLRGIRKGGQEGVAAAVPPGPRHATCLLQAGLDTQEFARTVLSRWTAHPQAGSPADTNQQLTHPPVNRKYFNHKSINGNDIRIEDSSELLTLNQSFNLPEEKDIYCEARNVPPASTLQDVELAPQKRTLSALTKSEYLSTRPSLTEEKQQSLQMSMAYQQHQQPKPQEQPLPPPHQHPLAPPSRYGVTGLHTCGDLAATLLNLFVTSPECRYIASIGCCHMKLTTTQQGTGSANSTNSTAGYPLSSHCQQLSHHHLSYAARELSCHAIEAYADRLAAGADDLKVHCYRAALEWVLVRRWPRHRRAGLRPVKRAHTKTFAQYAVAAVSALDGGALELPLEELTSLGTQQRLGRWWQVVVFYSLRLLLAPVIETVILLDRSIFLQERGIASVLVPIFDPALSPRNMVLLAVKPNVQQETGPPSADDVDALPPPRLCKVAEDEVIL